MERLFPNLISPIRIGSHVYKNRILTSPVFQPFYSVDGKLTPEAHAYLADQAKGGAAQVTLGEHPVDPQLVFGRGFDILGDEIPKAVQRSLASFILDVHNYGALASIELGHPGQGLQFPQGVKGRTYGPIGYVREDGAEVAALKGGLMDMVCEQFARTAERVKHLGFDGVVIHSAHGCLLAQFLSARTNKRTDEYGGPIENRVKFPIMVLERVRERVGRDFIIELRISGREFIEGGITIEDNITYCSMLEGIIDIIHVSAGIYEIPELFIRAHPVIYYPPGCNADLAAGIRAKVNIPVAVVGAINSPELAEEIIASGKADLVALGRQTIADPYFAKKATEERPQEITPCVRCLNCMDIGPSSGLNLRCTVNPRAGRALYLPEEYPKAAEPGKVVVVGGGPGGMKAAITARLRGHRVVLFEKTGSLGGIIKFTDKDVFKGDLKRFKDHLIERCNALGVDIRLNTEVTPEAVEAEGPHAVIVAVGAEPLMPPIPGIDGEKVMHALEAYEDMDKVGLKVVMVGGGLAGCETGVHLAKLGREVTIIEMTDTVAEDCRSPHRIGLLEQMNKLVSVKTGLHCTKIEDGKVTCADAGGGEICLTADTVVYALGMKPREDLACSFRNSALCFASVGDCSKAGKVLDAVHQGYYVALGI